LLLNKYVARGGSRNQASVEVNCTIPAKLVISASKYKSDDDLGTKKLTVHPITQRVKTFLSLVDLTCLGFLIDIFS
jgi:hypothetical protein